MRILLVGIFLLLSSSTYADDYWVLGSFELKSHGAAEAARIKMATGLDVRLVRDQVNYRIVVPKSDDAETRREAMERIEAEGIKPWTWRDASPGDELPLADDGRYFAVVASFVNRSRADAAAERLQGSGFDGVSVMGSDDPGQQFFRVVQGPHMSRDAAVTRRLTSAGFEGIWWLSESPDDIAPTRPDELAETAVQGSQPTAIVPAPPPKATPAALTVNPPRAGESHLDYCLNHANQVERRIYCADSSFNDVVKAERRVIDRNTYLLEFCALRANAEERQKYCGD